MPKPRKLQIALSETPYYHLISRCVRRRNTGHPQITAGIPDEEYRTSTDYRTRLDINLFATKFKANGFVTVRTTSCLNHVSYKSL